MTNQAIFLIRSIKKKQNFIKKQILKNKKINWSKKIKTIKI